MRKVNTVDCWLWAGVINDGGYGIIRVDNSYKLAHRIVYEALVGDIPSELEIDHLCRITNCVNPEHLEPVTHQENAIRGLLSRLRPKQTHCKRGHKYTEIDFNPTLSLK